MQKGLHKNNLFNLNIKIHLFHTTYNSNFVVCINISIKLLKVDFLNSHNSEAD